MFIIVFEYYMFYMNSEYRYRKVQGIVGTSSFSIILPKDYAIHLGIGKGDFVKVRQEENKIIIEKAWGDKNEN